MKYAPWILLLLAAPVHAGGWEWRRQSVTAEDRAEIKRLDRLSPMSKYQLDSLVECERAAFNDQTLMQYNRMLPIPLPMAPTPEVAVPRRSPFRVFH